MVHKFECEVTTVVEVELDDESLNEEFMAEFRASFYPFKTLEDHAKHLAQLTAREMTDGFVEGYGYINGSTEEPNVKASAKVVDGSVIAEEATPCS